MQNNEEMLENPYYKKLKDFSTTTGKPEKEHYEIMMKTLANVNKKGNDVEQGYHSTGLDSDRSHKSLHNQKEFKPSPDPIIN